MFVDNSLVTFSGVGLLNNKVSKRRVDSYEWYISLSVHIFGTQNLALINSLKDFLTCLPSPTAIEQVLLTAVCQLVKKDMDACRWILEHQDYLMPELDLVEVMRNWTEIKLQNQGAIEGKDFNFAKRSLLISQKAKTALISNCSPEYIFIFQKIFEVVDCE